MRPPIVIGGGRLGWAARPRCGRRRNWEGSERREIRGGGDEQKGLVLDGDRGGIDDGKIERDAPAERVELFYQDNDVSACGTLSY